MEKSRTPSYSSVRITSPEVSITWLGIDFLLAAGGIAAVVAGLATGNLVLLGAGVVVAVPT